MAAESRPNIEEETTRFRELARGQPLLSVVLPIRQEERHIAGTLDAVLAQDVDTPFEVLVVDGRSTDRTREIVEEISARDPRVRLLDNPGGIVPTAMNVGIREARGDFIVRVDGHCRIPVDYLRQVLEGFRESGSACVGGSMIAEGETYWGRLIARATSSAFGMGGRRFHGQDAARELDTVYLGAYPREILLALGGYDEKFIRNQDDELNYRLRSSGRRVWFTPKIHAAYTCRPSLKKLASQYLQYGWWKTEVYRKHPGQLNPRHLIPSAFVLGGVSTVVAAAILGGWFWLAPAAVAAAWLAAGTWVSLSEGTPVGQLLPILLVCFVIHVSYGVGFLAGLLRLPVVPTRRSDPGLAERG